jgi:hypothetical protein
MPAKKEKQYVCDSIDDCGLWRRDCCHAVPHVAIPEHDHHWDSNIAKKVFCAGVDRKVRCVLAKES